MHSKSINTTLFHRRFYKYSTGDELNWAEIFLLKLWRFSKSDFISDFQPISAGVPQAGILGLVLHLIYTSDMPYLNFCWRHRFHLHRRDPQEASQYFQGHILQLEEVLLHKISGYSHWSITWKFNSEVKLIQIKLKVFEIHLLI